MPKFTFASLFSGGGGADCGLEMAGGKGLWAIESDPSIASVFKRNFPDILMINEDIRRCSLIDCNGGIMVNDEHLLQYPDVLWISPPCQAYSTARSKGLPSRADGDVGLKSIEFIALLKPSVIFLENVPAYQKSYVYQSLLNSLRGIGYWTVDQLINFDDLGVPQSRKRLVMMAFKRHVTPRSFPLPSESEGDRKASWFYAIEDLFPDSHLPLPDGMPLVQKAPLAEWQIKRLQKDGLWDELPETCLIQKDGTNSNGKIMVRGKDEPMWTIRAMGHSGHWRQASIRYKGDFYEINARCLARWQSFPDSYYLPHLLFPDCQPPLDVLACRIIGNSVPPLGACKLVKNAFGIT